MMPASPWIGSSSTATVFVVDRAGQRGGVAERHRAESRCERSESVPRRRIRGEADDADRAAVEVVVGHDDIGLARRGRP